MEISKALLDLGYVDISKVMGNTDALKLRSSMTLFNEIEKISGIDCSNIFEKILIQFFNNQKDINTLNIIKNQKITVDRQKINKERENKEKYKLYFENNAKAITDNETIIINDSKKDNNNFKNFSNVSKIDRIINNNSINGTKIESIINNKSNNSNINIPEITSNNTYIDSTKNNNTIAVNIEDNIQNANDLNNVYKIIKENSTDKINIKDKDIYNIGTNTINYYTYNSFPKTYYNVDYNSNFTSYGNYNNSTSNVKAITTKVNNTSNDFINNSNSYSYNIKEINNHRINDKNVNIYYKTINDNNANDI